MNDQQVIVEFFNDGPNLDLLYALEDRLLLLLADGAVGEYDGNELRVGGGEARLYFCGPDANALYARLEGLLAQTPFLQGAVARLRYGPKGAPERLVTIGEQPHVT